MKFRLLFTLLFLSTLLYAASEIKHINKSFKVKQGQGIEINSVSGVNVIVRSWDKDEIKFDLKVKMNSTDEKYEETYVNEFKIREWENGSNLVLDFVETDESVSWSFWDIFKLKFGVIVDKDIECEILVPYSNSLKMNIRYSNIQLSGMKGELEIIGRGNDIYLSRCDSINRIENLYGDIKIENCGGNLDLESRSSAVTILGFNGNASIDALYSAVTAEDISGNLTVVSRSEDIKIRKVGAALDVSADYSDIDIKNVTGFASVVNRGGSSKINNAGGLFAKGPYCDIYADKINGTAGDTIAVENRSGIIDLSEVVGVIEIDDEYSEINLREITGNVNISARSNSIRAFGIDGDWVSRSQYCSIEIRKLNADLVKISNRSEALAITMNKLPSRIDINNEYGEVDISVAGDIAGDITLDAKYGDIETDLPLRFRQDGSSSFAYGIIGNSKNIINILTRSGDIKFREY